MLHLFEHETVIDAPAETGEPAAAAEPAAPIDGGEPALEAAPEATGFDAFRNDPAFRDAVAEEADALVQARFAQLQKQQYQQQQYAPGATQGPMSGQFPGEYDPFDAGSVAAHDQWLLSQMAQIVQAQVAPVTQTFQNAQQQQALEQGEQYAQDMISDVVARGGDLTDEGKNAIRGLAEAFMPMAVERYGESARAAEMAIETAYNTLRQVEQAAATKALAQHTNHVGTLAGVPAEPGAAGVASAIPGTPAEYRSQGAVASNLLRKYATAS